MIYTVRFLAFIELSGSSSYDSLLWLSIGWMAKLAVKFFCRSLFSNSASRSEARKLQHQTRKRLEDISKALETHLLKWKQKRDERLEVTGCEEAYTWS